MNPGVEATFALTYREALGGQRGAVVRLRDRAQRWSLVCADLAAIAVAVEVSALPHESAARPLALLAAWLLLNAVLGLYGRDTTVIDRSTLHEVPRLLESLAVGAGLIFLLGPAVGVDLSRQRALGFIAVLAVLMVAGRTVARCAVTRLCAPERAIIVGSGAVAELLAGKLRDHPRYGVEVVGGIDVPRGAAAGERSELRSLGALGSFREICQEHRIERVIVAFAALSHEELLDTIRASNALGLRVSIVPRLFEVLGRSLITDEVEGMSLLAVPYARHGRGARGAKRTMDVVGSAMFLIIFAPIMLGITVAIKLTGGGPVLFAQERVGRRNEHFRMFKFRTMIEGAEELKADLQHLNEAPYPLFKIADDPRITAVGRVIRRLSLDELPQLWNVLRGDMSLVGPRPLVPSEDEKVIGWHRARLDILPGLTGEWQVMGRNAIPLSEMVKLDYRYIADWSLWNDLKLLVRTAPIVLLRRGV